MPWPCGIVEDGRFFTPDWNWGLADPSMLHVQNELMKLHHCVSFGNVVSDAAATSLERDAQDWVASVGLIPDSGAGRLRTISGSLVFLCTASIRLYFNRPRTSGRRADAVLWDLRVQRSVFRLGITHSIGSFQLRESSRSNDVGHRSPDSCIEPVRHDLHLYWLRLQVKRGRQTFSRGYGVIDGNRYRIHALL